MELSDGSYHELTANQIAGSMLSQIDDKSHHLQLLIKINDHKSDGNKISIIDGLFKSRNVNNVLNKTTAGWKLQVE